MKNVLYLFNFNKDSNFSVSLSLVNHLKTKNVKVYVENEEFAKIANLEVIDEKHLNSVDFMIVLGGDGTLFRNAKNYASYEFPILGINMGRVGALTQTELHDFERVVDKALNDDYTVEHNLTCASSFLIKRLATALFSIDKQYNSNNLIQYYNENLTNYPTIVPIVNDNSTTLVWDNAITEIELYGNGLYAKTSLLTEKLNGYMGMVQDFGGRIKAYLDPARNLQMNIGDKIKTKFKVEIRC